CVPSRRSRRDGVVVWSIGAYVLAASSGSAAGTAPGAGAAPPVTDVAFHDGADIPVQALAFFPVVVLDADRAPPDAVRALARAGELAAFARRGLSTGRAAPLPIVDLESVPAGRRIEARRLAEQVSRAGLVPWVAIGGRDRLGLGAIEPIPRRVLVVQDSAEEP